MMAASPVAIADSPAAFDHPETRSGIVTIRPAVSVIDSTSEIPVAAVGSISGRSLEASRPGSSFAGAGIAEVRSVRGLDGGDRQAVCIQWRRSNILVSRSSSAAAGWRCCTNAGFTLQLSV